MDWRIAGERESAGRNGAKLLSVLYSQPLGLYYKTKEIKKNSVVKFTWQFWQWHFEPMGKSYLLRYACKPANFIRFYVHEN